MALLEVIQRKLARGDTLVKIIRSLHKMPILLALASLLLLINLCLPGNYRNTYISENALMPSQAHTGFRESEWNIVRGYRNELINMMNLNQTERNPHLQEWLKTNGYKTSYSTFVNSEGETKSTLYAIYHVPKGDDTEAMVLTAPWYSQNNKRNINGMAITMGLSQYLHRLSIWSKNIILVFPDNAHEDLRQWVDAYHTSLDHTGGSLESAVIVDYPSTSDYLSHIQIDYEGVNGQLPNLDLVNTAILVAKHESFKVSINNTPYHQLSSNDFFSRFKSLLSNIFNLAFAGSIQWLPQQSFSGWNVQSITLTGIEGEGPDITVLGRVIESTFRSVNNLLEKFHQSFFFYLMMDPNHFVSIANYLPAGCLLALGFVISSVNSFIGGIFIKRVQGDCITLNDSKASIKVNPLAWSFGISVGLIFSTIGYGTYLMTNHSLLDSQETWFNLTYNNFILPLLLVNLMPLLSIAVPFKFANRNNFIRGLSTILLFYYGYMLIAMLVLNFALPFVISLCSLMICYVRCTNKQFGVQKWIRLKSFNTIFLGLSSPAIWLVIVGIVNKSQLQLDSLRNLIQNFSYKLLQWNIQKVIDFFQDTPLDTLMLGPVEVFQNLVLSYEKIQCWTWIFITASWLPVWLGMCLVASLDLDETTEDDAKKNQ